MTLNVEIKTLLSGEYSRTVGLTTASYNFAAHPLNQLRISFADGVLTGLFADKIYLSHPDGITLAPSAATNLDLSGTVSDVSAENLALVKVKGVLLYNRPTADGATAHDLIVGNGANPFVGWFGAGSHTESVPPGGLVLHVHPGDGWPVTAGTVDILKILNGGAVSDVVYDLAVWGTSV